MINNTRRAVKRNTGSVCEDINRETEQDMAVPVHKRLKTEMIPTGQDQMDNTWRCGMKNMASPYTEKEYNGESELDTQVPGQLTLTAPTRQETSYSSVHILDLPEEVLSKIVHLAGTYSDIAALRMVCRKFCAVCCQVLLHSFYKIQVRPSPYQTRQRLTR
jgi:hypothetical protein